MGGRVKYAMGAMTANQFSQRCGISATYLNQLCIGKAKTLSAYNANRIAGASSMNVTVGWLLGMQQKAAPEPPAPTKQESQELPDLPDFWTRLEWAAKRDGRSLKKISVAADLSESMISMYLTKKITPMESKRKRIADVLNVPVDWLCAGLKSDWEKREENWKKRIAVEVQQKKEIDEGHLQEPQATATNAPILQSTGTHLHFEGVYSGDVLSALVSVLKGTYRVNLTIDEVGGRKHDQPV